jgi:hypothetical protein
MNPNAYASPPRCGNLKSTKSTDTSNANVGVRNNVLNIGTGLTTSVVAG